MTPETRSKLDLHGDRVQVTAKEAIDLLCRIFHAAGVTKTIAKQVAEHLTDTSLCGMESHGLMRILQYTDQLQSGYLKADAVARYVQHESGMHEIDGGGGIGIPAMNLAVEHGCRLTRENGGISALTIRNVGHTGRLGAFADNAAEQGFLTITFGGGNRRNWRQVAPHGGREAKLPTNPYCIGIPGGDRGPVVLDFATSKIAGGWIYAARSAGADLPENSLMDPDGNLTRDPEDYFRGGAILPAGGAKGYALALMAELVAEALLGPVIAESNWLMITIDASRYQGSDRFREIAEEILADIRSCPPAPGFGRVEIPGERERDYRTQSNGIIAVPETTWQQIQDLAKTLCV